MNEGEIVLSPARSGGPFDPMGCRSVDVWRRQDLRALVAELPGRWVMVTLTVDRSLWTCPEAAYQRCNERVRKVMGEVCPRGVWFAAFEVQTKTGDGWPHWHAVAWVPDDRSLGQIKRAAQKRWTVRTESVDLETGEVTASVESIGFVDVAQAREPKAVGSYIAKYITKPWKAVPGWMGRSSKRFRKVRASPGCYEVLERLGRHVRHVGGREAFKGVQRPTRPLFHRMAASGASLNAFRKVGHDLKFVGQVPVPATAPAFRQVVSNYAGRAVRLGKLAACRVVISGPALERLRCDFSVGFRRKYEGEELKRHVEAWAEMQADRRFEEGEE